ncbi:MAG: hypothetical protein ACI8PZ_002270, partial [Myxococcota bacterium]
MSGPSLDALQQWMQAVLVNPLADPKAWRRLPTALQADPVASLIRSNGRLTPRQHLALYQRSYLTRLRECMAAQFPALRQALGPELFQAFADQYLQDCPSTSATLNDLGDRLPAYLAQTRPDTDEDWPEFMIELATFQVAVNRLFDAHAPAAWEGPLQPVLELFAQRFSVGAYYRQATSGADPELPLPGAHQTLLVRRDFRLAVIHLLPEQHRFVELVLEGRSLAEGRAVLAAERGVEPEVMDGLWPTWRRHLQRALWA